MYYDTKMDINSPWLRLKYSLIKILYLDAAVNEDNLRFYKTKSLSMIPCFNQDHKTPIYDKVP